MGTAIAAVSSLLAVSSQEMTVHNVRSIRSVNGMDLADCTCKCCNDVDRPDDVDCPVEVVIVLNSAACVKEYWPKMKSNTEMMIDDMFRKQKNVKIGVVKYSTKSEVVSSFKSVNEITSLKEAVRGTAYMGHGDYIAKGLNEAYRMFTHPQTIQNRAKNAQKVVMVMTNSGVVEKNSIQQVKDATLQLRQISADMMVVTITSECKEQKACLSCCPDFNFLKKYIATRDRICAGTNEATRHKECVAKMNYKCKGEVQPGKCRKRGCDCECKQKKGPMGLMGPPGIPGQPGQPGRQGQPGQPGRSGMDGKPGSPGKAGINGEDGLSSQDVAPGSQGPRGPPGPPGPDGTECGPMGPPGSRGVPGPDGAHGNPGENGQPGARGAPGQRGAPGKKGHPGPQGAPGNPGQNGSPGKCGEVGRPGQPGSRGKPGLPGDAGNKGTPGTPGSKGQDGLPGVNGVPGRQGPPACAISLNSYQYIIKEEIQRKLASYPPTFRCNSHDGNRNNQIKRPRLN